MGRLDISPLKRHKGEKRLNGMSGDVFNGLPPFSFVRASSEASFSGCEEAGEAAFGGGTFSQFVPVGQSEVRILSVLLAGRTAEQVEIPARIYAAEPPGKGAQEPPTGRLLKETKLLWHQPTGEKWLDWQVDLTPLSGLKVGHYLRLELDLPEGIGWVRNRFCEPAFPGARRSTGNASDLPADATFCFRVSPAQPCFWPVNILPENGNANRFTGTWKSDPARELPQWIEVSWKESLAIDALELTFPDSPECPVRYTIEISAQTGARHTVEVEQNESSRAIHTFAPAILADCIRVTFFSTRGASSVSVNCLQVRRAT